MYAIKIGRQGVLGVSQFFSLQAPKQEGLKKYLCNGLEIFTKTLSFSDLTNTDSIIKASIIAIGSMIDDVLIDLEVYQDHNITKLGCAMYAGYKFNSSSLIKSNPVQDNIVKGAVGIGLGLFILSSLLGSGDIINAMRSNTKDCIEFSDKVFELSDGTVNPYNDLHIGNAVNTVIGGGRQFLNDIKLDMGGPISDIIKAGVTTSVNIAIGLKSTKDFKNALFSKFSSIDDRTLIELEKDTRAQKAMENLLSNIDKASSSITKTAASYSVKNFWQQILASKEANIGLHSFIASNLFNNIKIQNKDPYKSDDFESAVKSKDLSAIRDQLKATEQLQDKSYFSELYSFGKKAFETLAYPLAASFLVSAMEGGVKDQDKEIKFYDPQGFSKYFTPITSTLGMALVSTEDASQDALDDIQYLYDKIVEIQEGVTNHW